MALTIEHNSNELRFEYQENGHLCHLDYTVSDNIMTVTHTIVPSELGGKGLAGELTEAAFAVAKEQGWKINPVCSYTATYFTRHPEHSALLAS